MSMILVVAAHPDDEVLGAGGTVARRVSEGDTAYALVLGEGQTSRWDSRSQAERSAVDSLHNDSISASKILGYKDIYFGEFPDNRFDSADLLDIVKSVENFLEKLRPDIIYTHFGGDLNVDHQVTNQAVLTAARPQGDYSVREIYAFETVSSTEWNFGSRKVFCPNVFVNIEGYFQKKCDAMSKYTSELRMFPHPRSLQMLEITARKWGGAVGRQYAEAFELLRRVD
ncbi:MAG: PIG-L family deacetylase [Eubacterium sp.]|nr:PIG-L family deacetylase [Eubacterium sp.]MCI8918177.1 PIG-L family deacetylase [Eubacterium sp.]